MPSLSLNEPSHVARMVRHLAAAGWVPLRFPAEARLLPNRQLIELRTSDRNIRIRPSIYRVGGRGEAHRLRERRIEITTTFTSGLRRLRNWADVVLGYDPMNDAYVGLDPRRLNLGGETHNASSYVDPRAVISVSNTRLLVRPHQTSNLGLEYQAIFGPRRLGEYLFNAEPIHQGAYHRDGLFSGSITGALKRQNWTLPSTACRGEVLILTHTAPAAARRMVIPPRIIEAYERDDVDGLPDVSPEEFEAIQRKCRDVGDAGENFVYQYEGNRLRRTGRSDLAARIDWISQKVIGRGYDIKSFETDGSPRTIDVKATIGTGPTFFMSRNEWRVANRIRGSYWIYRVVQALDEPRISTMLRDPIGAEGSSQITRIADGWRVTIL
jgi:hypothetical protein